MKMTEAHLLLLETVLIKRGYHKYVPNDCNGTDLSRVCTNESFYWYKTLERVREEDEDCDIRTSFAVILNIPVWDHYQYVNPSDLISRYGATIEVQVCDHGCHSQFSFPFVQEDYPSFFFEFHPENSDNKKYVPKIIFEEDINKLIDSFEELSLECGKFYKEKCKCLINKKFDNESNH